MNQKVKVKSSIFTGIGRYLKGISWKIIIGILILDLLLVIAAFIFVFIGKPEYREVILDTAKGLGVVAGLVGSLKAYWKQIREKISVIQLQSLEGHIVICGLGDKGMRLLDSFDRKGFKIAVIEIKKEHPNVSACLERGIIVITGDASDIVILEEANAALARYVFALTDSDKLNINITLSVSKLLKNFNQKEPDLILRCFAHVADSNLISIFSSHSLFEKVEGRFDASMFSAFDGAARYILEKYSPDSNARMLGYSTTCISILVIGYGNMTESIMKHAARIGHYSEWEKLIIYVIDKNSKEAKEKFISKYKVGDSVTNLVPGIEIIFIDEYPEVFFSGNTLETIENLSVVYMVLEDEAASISLSIKIRSKLSFETIPIVICMRSALSEMMDNYSYISKRNIHIFNFLDFSCAFPVLLEEVTDEIAKAMHSGYINSLAQMENNINNSSLVSWEDLSEESKNYNRWLADHLPIKLRAIGYEEETQEVFDSVNSDRGLLEKLAEMEHRRWCAVLYMNGWRYAEGPKDPIQKTHNCLIDYEKLPESEKEKDRVMIRIMQSIVKNSGWKKQRDFIEGKAEF